MLKLWKNRGTIVGHRSTILDGSGLSCHWKNHSTMVEIVVRFWWIRHITVLLPAPS